MDDAFPLFKYLHQKKHLFPFINLDSTRIPPALPKSLTFEQYRFNIKKETFTRLNDLKSLNESIISRNAIIPIKKPSPFLPQIFNLQYHRIKYIEFKANKMIRRFNEKFAQYSDDLMHLFNKAEMIPPNFVVVLDISKFGSCFSKELSNIQLIQALHKAEVKSFENAVNPLFLISAYDIQKELISILKQCIFSADEIIRFFPPNPLQERFESLLLFARNSPCKKELIDLFKSFSKLTPETVTTNIVSIINIVTKKFKLMPTNYTSYLVPLFFRTIFNEVYTYLTFFNPKSAKVPMHSNSPTTFNSNPAFALKKSIQIPDPSHNSHNPSALPVRKRSNSNFDSHQVISSDTDDIVSSQGNKTLNSNTRQPSTYSPPSETVIPQPKSQSHRNFFEVDGTLNNGFNIYYNYSNVSNNDLFSYDSFDDEIIMKVHKLSCCELQPPFSFCPAMTDDDIPSEVFKHDPNYSLAVEQIEFMQFFTNPLDILHHVHYALHEIEMSAAVYAKDYQEEMLPFDVVFGLFTCVVLASDVPEFLRIAAFANVYAPQHGLCAEFMYANTKLKSESVQLNQLLMDILYPPTDDDDDNNASSLIFSTEAINQANANEMNEESKAQIKTDGNDTANIEQIQKKEKETNEQENDSENHEQKNEK